MMLALARLGIGSYYVRYFAVYIGAILLALLVVRLLRRRLPRRVRTATYLLAVFLGLRLALFDNPFILKLYQRALTVEGAGWRQLDVIERELEKYRREIDQPRLDNLAVGSSQVGAIFYNWVGDPSQSLGVFTLAGMKPLDMVLEEETIAAQNPARVILYLSAFDMTASPELFSLPLAPSRPLSIWPTYERLRASGLTAEETALPMHAYVAAQLVPEYRYAFVYRAFIRQWIGAAPRPVVPSQQRLQPYSYSYDSQWLDYNFLFLRDFLTFCRSRGIEVLIVEGQVNPKARTAAIDSMNEIVRSRIRELQRQWPTLRYVPTSELYQFEPQDYEDMVHVRPDAAKRFTARLSAYLARTDARR